MGLSISIFIIQVRGLTTTSFKSDGPTFEAMALASLDLCRTYMAMSTRFLAEGSAATVSLSNNSAAARDLAAARMHLRGVIKQCEPSFAEHAMLIEMKDLLDNVACMEERVTASRG